MPVTFGQWLKMRREMRGLSMNALGQKVGITHSHISNIESGKSEPHKDTVVAIAEALDVDPQEALRAFIGDPEIIRDDSPEITRERYADDDIPTIIEGYTDLPEDDREFIKSTIQHLREKNRRKGVIGALPAEGEGEK